MITAQKLRPTSPLPMQLLQLHGPNRGYTKDSFAIDQATRKRKFDKYRVGSMFWVKEEFSHCKHLHDPSIKAIYYKVSNEARLIVTIDQRKPPVMGDICDMANFKRGERVPAVAMPEWASRSIIRIESLTEKTHETYQGYVYEVAFKVVE